LTYIKNRIYNKAITPYMIMAFRLKDDIIYG